MQNYYKKLQIFGINNNNNNRKNQQPKAIKLPSVRQPERELKTNLGKDMDLKAWLSGLLKREPTEQELKEGSELVTPPTPPAPPAPSTPPAPPVQTLQGVMGDSAIMQEMQEIKNANRALLEKLNAEDAARKAANDAALAKAEADRKAAVEAKITEAKGKGIIPPDNKDAEANWRNLLNANFDSGVAVLMATAPINAGNPPAGNTQPNTGGGTGTPKPYSEVQKAAEAVLAPKK